MTTPAGPNDDVFESSGDSGWDDDVWGDEGDPPDRRTVLFVQIGLVLVIVAIVAAVLISKNGDDDGDSSTASGGTGATTQTTVPGGGAPVTGGPTEPAPLVWPTSVGGRPAAFGELDGAPGDAPGGAAPGVYIWSDYDGWHLWVVHGEGVGDVNGTVTGDDVVASAEVVPDGAGLVTMADQVIAFDIKDGETIAGFDFNPGFYAKRLEFVVNGADGPLPAELVHVGKDAVPAPTPIVIEKSTTG
ncbi:MAG: hypothetical protein KF703_13925 [Actinobacteria bacterium]|nr:hypothetical protein [Actinomycetota bacterium]